MKKLSFLLVLIIFLTGACQDSQPDYVKTAVEYIDVEDYDNAKAQIDLAAESEVLKDSAHTWYYRGYIYNQLYKRDNNTEGPERITAIDAYYKSLQLDSEGKYAEVCRESIVNIAQTYYNDAVRSIAGNDPERALKSFHVYLDRVIQGDPDFDIKPKQIDVYLALGGVYAGKCETNPQDSTCFHEAVGFYEKVLALDGDNLNANYNTAILYYNKAVRLIVASEACKQVDIAKAFDWSDKNSEVPDLEDIMGCLKLVDFKIYKIDVLFMQALPYLEKAEELDPDNPNIKIGLDGIRYLLENMEA